MAGIRNCTTEDMLDMLHNLERPQTGFSSMILSNNPLFGLISDKITVAIPVLARTDIATAAILLPLLCSAVALVLAYAIQTRRQSHLQGKELFEAERRRNDADRDLLQIAQLSWDLIQTLAPERAKRASCWIVKHQNAIFEAECWKPELYIKEVKGRFLACKVGSGAEFTELPDIDLYRCTVCWSMFDEGESTMSLPCAHKLHTACVKPLLMNDLLKCPRCTKGFELQAHLKLVEEANKPRRA